MPVQPRQVCHAPHLTAPLQTSRHCSNQACTTLAPSTKTGRLLPLLSALSVVYTAFPPPSCDAGTPLHQVSIERHFHISTSCKVAATTSSTQESIDTTARRLLPKATTPAALQPGWDTRMHSAARPPARQSSLMAGPGCSEQQMACRTLLRSNRKLAQPTWSYHSPRAAAASATPPALPSASHPTSSWAGPRLKAPVQAPLPAHPRSARCGTVGSRAGSAVGLPPRWESQLLPCPCSRQRSASLPQNRANGQTTQPDTSNPVSAPGTHATALTRSCCAAGYAICTRPKRWPMQDRQMSLLPCAPQCCCPHRQHNHPRR